MKRILSILLVLAMLLSMVPAVFAADCDITVSTPAPDPVKVGALYQLPLGTVFTDPNGHALSFALKADYGDKVYIKDNTLQFTSAEAGEFRIGITATCTGGGSAEVVVPITVEAVEDGGKNQYGYDETDQASVTVYVTISSDGAPIIGKDDGGTILSHLEVKVPYFPLSLYGLDDFNRYHTENGSGSYTDNEIVQRPTLLHLYIYMLERYYLGVAEKDCGKGTSGLLEFTGSGEGVNDMLGGSYKDTLNALLISGSATSMYMQNFWGHDENLMYYRNHVYPLMSAGWGSTADYILLSDNDTIDLAMFSNWSFWTYGAFARFDKDDYTAKVGEKITFETQKYDTKSVSDGGTESFEPITGLNVKLYNENWEQQQELTSEGSSYTLDTASLKAGTYYLLGYDPNYGTENACYAPATAKVVLTSEAPQPCQWDEGVVTTEPTCTTAGVKTFSCSVHGETRTEELPALGHTFGADGACIRCGEKDPAIPTQDESGVYGIASEKQLQWFAAKVNGGDTAISGKLTANIELTEAWTPMGSQKQPFTGSFDGDGHSITGMSITFDSNDKSVGAPYLGLFGYVKGTADKKAEIKNLMLSGKLDITENYRNSFAYSGGLVGGAEYVSFTDITTNVAVTAKKGSAPYPWSYVGGFAGTVKNADFLRCVNNGTVTTDGDYVSGFAAKSETTTYTSCVNNGAITGRTKIGGFGGAVKSTKTVDSYNTGTIGLAAYNGGNQGIGGLFGEMGYGSTLTRCYNTGAVTGDCYVGGLVGSVGSGSDAANGPSYIVDSYNSGSITGHSDKNYCGIGGLVGKLDASSSRTYEQSYVHNCYNTGTVTDLGLKTAGNPGAAIGVMHADYSEGSYLEVKDVYYRACGLEGLGKMNYSTMHDPSVFVEMSAEAMKASGFVTKLGASFKADGTCMQKVNGGYPILVWQKLAEGQSEHTLEVTTVVAPTCTEQGYTIYTCTACGEELKADFVPATGHSYEASVVAPTCEKDGYTNHVCSVCGDSYRDNYVDAAGHQYTDTVTAPTCTASGYTTHTCSVCGHSYVDSVVPATGHTYTESVTAPTCTNAGYTTHLCSVCGHSYVDSVVPATGHDYVWQITRVPTCTAEGVKTFTCSHCGDSYDVALAKADHTYEAVVTAPTCTNNGYTTHTCSVCGDSYVDSIVPATGHSYDAVVTAPTCTNAGHTTHTCSVCGDSYVDSIVPATGHSYEAVVTAPTCDKMGYTTYTCSVCGDSYVGSYTDALEHTYTAVVTKEPTCTEEGVKTFTCSECGKSYTEAIPTVAHRYEAVVTAPTCDKMGYTTYTCSACGDSYVADYVDAAGHDCETETVPATCLGYGFVRESCKHCDYSVITEITAPLGHDYEAVVTAPTLDEGGYTTHTCSRCGDSYVDSETPALGHKCAAYTDIPTDWAKEGICFVIENGLMVGTTSTTFAPKDTLTRAMLVTVLYRMAGSPAVDAPSGFTDVADGQWYSDAIAWAAANGIVNGVGGNKFAPSEPVTREQLAAIFFRYAKAEAPEADVLSGYPDAESVSTYARDAMAWAVSTGLVTGSKEADGTYLVPQGLAAREQAAAILMRYVKANA